MKNVLEYMEASAKRLPDKTALIDDKTSCTYRELEIIAKGIGYRLSEYITPGKPVAVMLKKSVLTMQLFFGTVYAGGFYSLTDPDFPVARIEQQLSVLQPEVVITAEEFKDKLAEAGYKGRVLMGEELYSEATKSLGETAEPTITESITTESITTEPTAVEPTTTESIATEPTAAETATTTTAATAKLLAIRESMPAAAPLYCNFTSGSTGTPKGVLVGHASVISFIDSFTDLFDITENDVIGNQAPFDFDVSVKDIYSTMKMGATMVIIPTAFFRFPNGVMDMLEEHKVTTLIWAVSALVLINRLHEFMYKIPPCINKVLFSGEEMPVKHLIDWMNTYPNAKFVNLYGPTEITCNCTFYRIDRVPEMGEKLPSGYVFPGKKLYLMGEDGKIFASLNPTEENAANGRSTAENAANAQSTTENTADTQPATQVGEICIGGNELALGYYNNEAATKAAFIDYKNETGETLKLYKTGDLGYIKDSILYFAGRRDFQIKHNGHRIELEEVERALAGLPEIQQACCLYDQEKYRIVAFCSGTKDRKAVVAGLRDKLPEYSLPNVYKFMDELPLTKNGKIDRKTLKEQM